MFKFFKKKKGIDLFLSVQDSLIERIKEDAATWQKALKLAEEEYGHNEKGFQFINAFAFYRLSFLDIAILFKNFMTSKEGLEKDIYAKMLALNLYEFFEDIPQIFGKDFRDSLQKTQNEELINEFQNIKKNIQQIKVESHSYLKEIRNTIASHKDHNTFTQVEVLKKIDDTRIEAYCVATYMLFLSISKFEKKIREVTKKTIANKNNSHISAE